MTTIAIIGAGPGLGASVAERFGREGFSVALISRTPEKLDRLGDRLTSRGIVARSYAADVRDRAALTSALDAASAELGPIEVPSIQPRAQPRVSAPRSGDHRGRHYCSNGVLNPRADDRRRTDPARV